MSWLVCVVVFLHYHPVPVRAIPLLQGGSAAAAVAAMRELEIRHAHVDVGVGEPAKDRSIFTVISLVCMMVLSLLLGFRFTKLKRSIVSNRSFVSMLVLTLYVLVLMFIICSAVLVAGQGLYTHALCRAGTWVCLIFYTFIKAIIYIFLVERIHVVRAPFVNRTQDKIYLACMTMIIVMYSSVAINSYIHHVTEMRASDGRCHFGIRGIVSIPFTVVNFFTDVVLTCVFFYLLLPAAQISGIRALDGKSDSKSGAAAAVHGGNDTPARKNIRTLLWKSIVGSLLIEIPTAANMIQFVITRGEELGVICLIICLVDVFWDALVIYWLTFSSSGPNVSERDLSASTATSSEDSLSRVPARTQSRLSGQGAQIVADESASAHTNALDFLYDSPRESTSGLVRSISAKQ
ncbi:hypothetical protein BDW02DRAFT_577321 [Decorospora gaudefroyi]|uniref:G-protein coupled receptors family 1 profile domain-containing protein n=1 Tax=Decorospora gaudefroyi TaxID=184978 RepID=A0A6A5KQ57_9PLEO|nr:hypothetical protein BDW02DRAFT_577321 [Decorospora gaudefroyi]